MKNIIAFGASNSKNSINQRLAVWAANQLNDVQVQELNLNDFEAPIYSIERELETGTPVKIANFKEKIKQADGIVISLAEHNGNFTAAFKNIYDWLSRMDRSIWMDKPMLLLSSSPGGRGGASVHQIASESFPHAGGNIIGSFQLPSFNSNFTEDGISNKELLFAFQVELQKLQNVLIPSAA